MCPITDVKLFAPLGVKLEEYLEAIDPEKKLDYIQVDPPADSNASWTLLYSRKFDSTPIRDFQFQNSVSCQGKMLGDPNIEMFSKQRDSDKIYYSATTECTNEGAFQLMERESFTKASHFTPMYTEYDFL